MWFLEPTQTLASSIRVELGANGPRVGWFIVALALGLVALKYAHTNGRAPLSGRPKANALASSPWLIRPLHATMVVQGVQVDEKRPPQAGSSAVV